jgi:hypothetical protein
VAFRQPEVFDDTAWRDLRTARFTQYYPRETCANVSVEINSGAFVLTTGGTRVGDPSADATLSIP